MHEQPVLVHKYGHDVWSLPAADTLRQTDCLCRNCDRLKPGSVDNCRDAQALYEICVRSNIATFITRCAAWQPNTSRTGGL